MKVVQINGNIYLTEKVVNENLISAVQVNDSFDKISNASIYKYIKYQNMGVLQNISFGNQVFQSRDFTPMESGAFTVAESTMAEAKKNAIAVIENQQFDSLMGKM